MILASSLQDPALQQVRGAVVSIGNFDGVHVGHRELLSEMYGRAESRGRPAVVVTFFPPAKVFFTGADYLSTAEEKRQLLQEFGPGAIVTIPFDEQFSQTSKQQFLDDLALLRPSTVVVGADFRFGRGRAGSVNDLAQVAPVQPIELVNVGGTPVGSSRIRELLAAGSVEAARTLLGQPYLARGRVVAGQRRGRTLGFPTANLALPARKALPPGVFAVHVDAPTGRYGGMANVGPRPTFPDEPPSLEVHLFGFDGDLYDEEIVVYFYTKLRDQVRFASIADLKAQLEADKRLARVRLPRV